MAKTCTTLRLTPTGEIMPVPVDLANAVPGATAEVDAQIVDAQIVDVSVVPDDHTFGLDPETGLLHVEGKIVAPEIRTQS